jgi:hypothetical protein
MNNCAIHGSLFLYLLFLISELNVDRSGIFPVDDYLLYVDIREAEIVIVDKYSV